MNIKMPLIAKNIFFRYLKSNNIELNLILLSIVIFTLLRLPYFTSDAFVPDEVWHTGYMKSRMNILHVPNYQGHGAGFWILGKILYYLLGKSDIFLFIMKMLSLASLTLSVYYINRIGEIVKSSNRFLIILCLLTTPLFWWGGKLIFPEFYSIFLLVFSLYYLLKFQANNNLKFPWILMGFAVGMKFTAIPVVVFIFLISLSFNRPTIGFNKKILMYSANALLWFVVGFIICNPFLFLNPQIFFDELLLNGSYTVEFSTKRLFHHYKAIISNDLYAWDVIYFGGINESVIPILSFILAFIYLLLGLPRNWRIILSVILSYLVFITMITLNHKSVSYYFFQSAIIIFIAMLFIRDNLIINRRTPQILCLLVITINLLTTIPIVVRDSKIRFHQAKLLKQWQINTNCVKDSLNNIEPVNLIINNAGPGGNYKRREIVDFQYIASKLDWVKDGLNSKTLIVTSGNYNSFNYSLVRSNLKKESEKLGISQSKARRIVIIEGKWTYNVPEYINYHNKFLEFLRKEISYYQITEKLLTTCGENNIWMIYLL
jgi:hypothetical protein